MKGEAVVVECEHREEHPQIQEALEGQRRDINRHEGMLDELFELARTNAASIGTASAGIARIEGNLEGAMRAKKISGALLGAIVTFAGGAIITLLVALIRASGHGG